MLWISPNNFAYQKSRRGWNYHWKMIFSTIFHLYSKIHNKQSLEGRKLEQVVCWCKFTSFLKLGVNRIFWRVLVRQLMKIDDFFAVLEKEKWKPVYRNGCECRKDRLVRMKRQRIVLCWKLDDFKIKFIIKLHHFALKNWMSHTSSLNCSK